MRSLDEAIEEPETFRSRHCSAEEYDAFLASCDVGKHFTEQRRSHRKIFVQAWPDLEDWLHAPLAVRVGRTEGKPGRRFVIGHLIGRVPISTISR
jgi:hypothetical protein